MNMVFRLEINNEVARKKVIGLIKDAYTEIEFFLPVF